MEEETLVDEIRGLLQREIVHCFQYDGRGTCPPGLKEGIAGTKALGSIGVIVRAYASFRLCAAQARVYLASLDQSPRRDVGCWSREHGILPSANGRNF
jgi:hypothetical protein